MNSPGGSEAPPCSLTPLHGCRDRAVASLPQVSPVAPTVPFSVAWLSRRLYRVTADHGPAGKSVEVDGWTDALDDAWRQLIAPPDIRLWVADYLDCRGAESLIVTFGDTSRVVARGGDGYFGVSYPTDHLLAGADRVSAMRTAILVVLDRHVDRRKLDVPLLSGLVGAA